MTKELYDTYLKALPKRPDLIPYREARALITQEAIHVLSWDEPLVSYAVWPLTPLNGRLQLAAQPTKEEVGIAAFVAFDEAAALNLVSEVFDA